MHDRVIESLAAIGTPARFAVRRTSTPDDLQLEVKGVGSVPLPVSKTRVRKLRSVARPAPYGQREQTLLDPQVRDTWEVPKSRVRIDKRRWNRALLPQLEQIGSELGLPVGCNLKAELHSMLLYEPGQFFAPHQDSEKSDDMVGQLGRTAALGGEGRHFSSRTRQRGTQLPGLGDQTYAHRLLRRLPSRGQTPARRLPGGTHLQPPALG